MIAEPRLSHADIKAWDVWMRTCLLHARTRGFMRKVDSAKDVISEMVARFDNPCVMWSGGKDSTVMTYLICVECGVNAAVYSEKDDLDYPGELEYVISLGDSWRIDLTILKPPISLVEWVQSHSRDLSVYKDIHSRDAELSKVGFYPVIQRAVDNHNCTCLGLRSEESPGRRANRNFRGRIYTKKSGETVCLPIADWTAKDVYAYAFSRGVDLFLIYRCIAFAHADCPWKIRKSWWLGSLNTIRDLPWLRHYYPSLWYRVCGYVPGSETLA